MVVDWSAACSSVQHRVLHDNLSTVYGVGYSLVAAFAATAATSGMMLYLFLRLEVCTRHKFWPRFESFLASCCIGSVVGAAAWAARSQSIALEFAALEPFATSPPPPAASALSSPLSSASCDFSFYVDYNTSAPPSAAALSNRIMFKVQGEIWNAIFFTLYPLELLLLTLAKGGLPLAICIARLTPSAAYMLERLFKVRLFSTALFPLQLTLTAAGVQSLPSPGCVVFPMSLHAAAAARYRQHRLCRRDVSCCWCPRLHPHQHALILETLSFASFRSFPTANIISELQCCCFCIYRKLLRSPAVAGPHLAQNRLWIRCPCGSVPGRGPYPHLDPRVFCCLRCVVLPPL
jgi:hypothetical protein